MEKIMIVADLGHFKAYRYLITNQKTPSLKLIESFDYLDAHSRISEKVADSLGSFGEAGSMGWVKGSAESHSLENETERRLINNIIESIKIILKKSKPDTWYLAAPTKIMPRIENGLDSEQKESLKKSISADLTKLDKNSILKYLK